MSDATFVYDDDCSFCTWTAREIADRADVTLVGFSELTDDQRDRLPDDYADSAHLLTDDDVYSGGAAIEQAVVRADEASQFAPLVDFLRQFDEYNDLRERAYRKLADRRSDLGALFHADPPASDSDA